MNNIAYTTLLVLMMAMIFAAGASLGQDITTGKFQKQAIERGFAAYDAVSGEWKWVGADE